MSARKMRIELSENAIDDFRDILSFTLQTWGEDQFEQYKKKLNDAFQTISENPDLGRKRYGKLVYFIESHQIYYKIEDECVYIIRILHKRMDPRRHIDDIHP